MSCWVTPSVAAEYWGVTLDVVWDRIQCELVPHKTERGFVFIDVDPWTPEFTGRVVHEPPPTFIPAAGPEMVMPVMSGALLCAPSLDPEEEVFLSSDLLSNAEESYFATDQKDELGDDGDSEDEVGESEEELPDLDEEESATFGRLSWQDVRQSVGRTRRPPPRAA